MYTHIHRAAALPHQIRRILREALRSVGAQAPCWGDGFARRFTGYCAVAAPLATLPLSRTAQKLLINPKKQ